MHGVSPATAISDFEFTIPQKSAFVAASFIVQRALERQAVSMRGNFVILGVGIVALGAFASPDAAMARENDQVETASCPDPKYRPILVRPLVESLRIRKTEKLRVRRILM